MQAHVCLQDNTPFQSFLSGGKTLVSVIIPVFNCEPYIAAAIDSVLAQDFSDLEIIVIDDGSTDGTPMVLEQYSGRIRLVRQKNAGVSSARNAGLDIAKGEYIAFLDADDVWYKEKLGIQVKTLEAFPEIAGVFSNFQTIDKNGGILERNGIQKLYSIFREHGETIEALFASRVPIDSGAPASGRMDFFYGNIFKSLFKGNFINTSSIVLRKAALKGVGFNTSQRTQEDYDLWMRLSKDHPLGYIDIPLLYTRKRPGQLTGMAQIEEIALGSLEIVEKFSRDTGLLGKDAVKRRLSRKYGDLGAIYLGNNKAALARAALLKSLSYEPFNLRHILFLFLSGVPFSIRSSIKNGARSIRKRKKGY